MTPANPHEREVFDHLRVLSESLLANFVKWIEECELPEPSTLPRPYRVTPATGDRFFLDVEHHFMPSTRMLRIRHTVDSMALPVGACGDAFTSALLQTYAAVIDQWHPFLSTQGEAFEAVMKAHAGRDAAVIEGTFWGPKIGVERGAVMSFHKTFIDGHMSMAQLINYLAAYGHPDFPPDQHLVQAIAEGGLIDNLTGRLPPAYTAPAARRGLLPKETLLSPDSRAGLVLTPQADDWFRRISADWKHLSLTMRDEPGGAMFGFHCFAAHLTGIDKTPHSERAKAPTLLDREALVFAKWMTPILNHTMSIEPTGMGLSRVDQ